MVLKLTLAAPYVSSPVAVCRWVRRILPRCPCLLLDFTSKLHSSVYCISIAAYRTQLVHDSCRVKPMMCVLIMMYL